MNVSQHLIEFARSNGISEKISTSIGLVIEKISTNINDINHKPVNINFTCKLYQTEVILNIKYISIIENVSNNDNDMNMSLIKQVVKDIKYSKINNQNDIKIVINRE